MDLFNIPSGPGKTWWWKVGDHTLGSGISIAYPVILNCVAASGGVQQHWPVGSLLEVTLMRCCHYFESELKNQNGRNKGTCLPRGQILRAPVKGSPGTLLKMLKQWK